MYILIATSCSTEKKDSD